MTDFEKEWRHENDQILVFLTISFAILGLATFAFGIDWVLTGVMLVLGVVILFRILAAFYRIGKAFLK